MLKRRWAGKLSLFSCAHCDPALDEITISMTTEQELRQKLRKISALFEGATNSGRA